MSDNDFNNHNNGEKDHWDGNPENPQDVQPSETELPNEPETQENPQISEEQAESAEEPKDEAPANDHSANPADPNAPTDRPADFPTDAPHTEQPVSPYGQQQYQNPQNPYTPYGQYNNPYGQPRNPYENYNNPYNGYGQYQYGRQQEPQYWSYQQYGGQNQQQNPQQSPQQPKPPKKKNTGLRVFLWILGVLIAAFVLGFCIYGVNIAISQKGGWPEITNSQPDKGNNESETGPSSSQPQIEGGVPGDGTNSSSSGITIQPQPAGNGLSAKTVYKKVVESVVGVETTVASTAESQGGVIQGTGIIATKDGYILTNAHVVNYSRANKVKVTLHNKKQYSAKVVGYDKTSDIAVLRINANDLSAAVFGNADQLEIGDSVIAIGNPGGIEYASSLTGGYVSALNRAIESHSDNGMTYIQTDAAINPGNSGGPLVNMYGQVVGINSNKIVATGYEGMGFAIPVSKAKTIIDDLIARGYVSGRSRLGITASTITDIQSQLSGYPTGVMIREISPESDLTKSNVVAGDIITKADGQKITSMEDLYAVLNKHKAGDTITLTIYKIGSDQSNGKTMEVKTKLLEDKGETQAR